SFPYSRGAGPHFPELPSDSDAWSASSKSCAVKRNGVTTPADPTDRQLEAGPIILAAARCVHAIGGGARFERGNQSDRDETGDARNEHVPFGFFIRDVIRVALAVDFRGEAANRGSLGHEPKRKRACAGTEEYRAERGTLRIELTQSRNEQAAHHGTASAVRRRG